MTVKQAASKIGISPSLVYALCQTGFIRHTRHGRPGKRGTIRISEEAVAAYLSDCGEQRLQENDGGAAYQRHAK